MFLIISTVQEPSLINPKSDNFMQWGKLNQIPELN